MFAHDSASSDEAAHLDGVVETVGRDQGPGRNRVVGLGVEAARPREERAYREL
jgi:hypothetical protein